MMAGAASSSTPATIVPTDPTQQRREILAVHVLHRHERPALPLGDVMDTTDIRMRDLPGGARLLAQTRDQAWIVVAHELQGHRLAERQIVRAIDLAHAAAAEQADDPVARAEQRAGRERAMVDVPARTGRRLRPAPCRHS